MIMVCLEMEYNQILCRALPSQFSRKLPLSKFGVTKSYGICGFGHSFLDPHIEEIMEIVGTEAKSRTTSPQPDQIKQLKLIVISTEGDCNINSWKLQTGGFSSL